MPLDAFFKVKLGEFHGQPAVVITDRRGAPCLWAVGENPLAAIRRMRAFCDEQEKDILEKGS